MSSSSLFVFLSFALLLQIAIGVDPLFSFCSNSDNFTSNSLYEKNLDRLLGNLYFKTPPTGFGKSSSGNENQEQAFGLSLCRGDVSSEECKTCVVDASSEIHKLCPYNKRATIWYDNCLLKYSNTDFFGQIDDQASFYLLNVNSVNNSQIFNQKTNNLLTQLSEEASVAPKLYATGELKVEESEKLYGLVQCTRDLSRVDCKKCLDDAVSQLPTCCDGKQGGRVVGGSCNIRYEVYPFYSA